jgi:hypothetical protein
MCQRWQGLIALCVRHYFTLQKIQPSAILAPSSASEMWRRARQPHQLHASYILCHLVYSQRQELWRGDVLTRRRGLWRWAKGPFFEIFPKQVYLWESFTKRVKKQNKKLGAEAWRHVGHGIFFAVPFWAGDCQQVGPVELTWWIFYFFFNFFFKNICLISNFVKQYNWHRITRQLWTILVLGSRTVRW